MRVEHINAAEEADEPQIASPKAAWITTGVILLVAIGIIIGVLVGANGELAKKDQEIAKLRKNADSSASTEHDTDNEPAEAPGTSDNTPSEPAKTEHSLNGFDTKIEESFKLLHGTQTYLQFKKMVATKDGEYMFILGEERGYNGGGGLAEYYRSTDSNGTWKYYAGSNGLTECSKFNEEQINLAKKYATELGLINSCTDSENETKNISDL